MTVEGVRLMRRIRQEVNSLLLRGVYIGNPQLIGMCTESCKHRDRL